MSHSPEMFRRGPFDVPRAELVAEFVMLLHVSDPEEFVLQAGAEPDVAAQIAAGVCSRKLELARKLFAEFAPPVERVEARLTDGEPSDPVLERKLLGLGVDCGAIRAGDRVEVRKLADSDWVPGTAIDIDNAKRDFVVVIDGWSASNTFPPDAVRYLGPPVHATPPIGEEDELRNAQRRLASPSQETPASSPEITATQQYATLRAIIRRVRPDTEAVVLSSEHGAMRLFRPAEFGDVWLPIDIMTWGDKAEAVRHVQAALVGLLGPWPPTAQAPSERHYKTREYARDILDMRHSPSWPETGLAFRIADRAAVLAELVLGKEPE
jgi:hypothetical protein